MASIIKKYFFALILVAFASSSYAQFITPKIEWAKCFGGTDLDDAFSIEQTVDKGFIVAGVSYSFNGDVTGHHDTLNSNADYWIVKLDSIGNLTWERTLGGDGDDIAYSIKQISDGGYIVAGSSNSTNGDVTGNHGGVDYWIVKLDSSGKILWQKSLGGSSDEFQPTLELTYDGGCIISGASLSNDGNVTGHHGSPDSADCWIVKLDPSGKIQWEKSYGSNGYDLATGIKQTSDHGFIVSGISNSIDNGFHSYGSNDFLVMKLDSNGALQWQQHYGGKGDDGAFSIDICTDGGYIITGYSGSNSGQVPINHGQLDFWVIKIDGLGNLLWQKSFGGSEDEIPYSIKQTFDQGFIVAGYTNSNDGNVTGNHGGNDGTADYLIIKLDSAGNLQWQKTLGGTGNDNAYCIRQTIDSGLIIAGFSDSDDGDVTGHHFHEDYWIVKLRAHPQSDVPYSENLSKRGCFNYPNPFTSKTTIVLSEAVNSTATLLLYNLLGEQMRKLDIPAGDININIDRTGLASGVYIYRIMNAAAIIASGNLIVK